MVPSHAHEPPRSTDALYDAEAIERLICALPEETFHLVVREAYLIRAGQLIADARAQADARRGEVSATRPPFFALRRAETKDAFASSLAAANDDLSRHEKTAERNAEILRRLRKYLERQLDACLRQNDAAYYAGLVSESLVADWHRCVSRLESNLTSFIKEIGSARNSLVGAQVDRNGVRVISEVSRKAIQRAAELGGALASEVTAITKLTEERDRHVRGTAFAKEFPRLPKFDFGASLQTAADLPVAVLQEQFSAILQSCDELRLQGLPLLLEKVKEAEATHAAVKESYLLGVWAGLRNYAAQHYVQEDDLQEVARATETMFEHIAG